jgi:hypothetical protein
LILELVTNCLQRIKNLKGATKVELEDTKGGDRKEEDDEDEEEDEIVPPPTKDHPPFHRGGRRSPDYDDPGSGAKRWKEERDRIVGAAYLAGVERGKSGW